MGTSLALLLFLVAPETAFSLSKVQDVIALGKAINQFGLDIHRNIAAYDHGNMILSPLGISIVFGMLNYGSGGKTAEEMRPVIGYDDVGLSDSEARAIFKNIIETTSNHSNNQGHHQTLDNAIFTQKGYPFRQEYKDGLLQYYLSNELVFDFWNKRHEAVEFMNECVRNDTYGQIEKSLDDVDPSTVMMLLNDMYLNATWKTEFDSKCTTEVFYNYGSKSKQTKVEMMHLVEELQFLRFGEGYVLALPYKGEDISMALYLPDTMTGAFKTEQKHSSNVGLAALSGAEKVKVHLVLPKFKLAFGTATLNTALQKIGIKNIFENSADLTGISKPRSIFVSEVMQKAVIDVNNKYTEASEFTGAAIETIKGREGNKKVNEAVMEGNEEGSKASRVTTMGSATRMEGAIKAVFNHPFLFAIFNEKNHIIYFQGHISNL